MYIGTSDCYYIFLQGQGSVQAALHPDPIQGRFESNMDEVDFLRQWETADAVIGFEETTKKKDIFKIQY